MKYLNLVLLLLCSFLLFCSTGKNIDNLADYASPLVGTDSEHAFSNGNTYPAIALPFGMTFWTPQTGKYGDGWIYQYKKDKINGFKATHQPSPWIGNYGDFAIMPVVGDLKVDLQERASTFTHENEIARPYYYSVKLDKYNVIAELAPTTRCSQMQFTFPQSDQSYILIDGNTKGAWIKYLPEEKKLVGYSKSNRGGVPDNFASYFVIKTDREISDFGTWNDSDISAQTTEIKDKHAGFYLKFKTTDQEKIALSIGTSFISAEQAEKNLQSEIGAQTFADTKQKAQTVWNEELNKIKIKGATEDQKQTFYTAFYRALLFPRIWYEYNENGDPIHFSPYDGKVYDGEMYADNGFWDTFRAVYPFFSILYPEKDAEIIRGWINAYKEGGWFPKWTSPGYRDCMIGTHVESLIADAYFKGIRDFDLNLAYEACVKDATQKSEFGGYGRKGIEYYKKLGYVPCDKIGEATARTLEFAYDDYCVARVAQALNKKEDSDFFINQSMTYKNVFDASTGFMRGRLANGTWEPNFNPVRWGNPFTEGSSWHYTWSVLHDVQGLIDLMGGKENFVTKLDEMFSSAPDFEVGHYGREIHEMTEMVACNMGQYAHGNQPVHHVLYLYNYAGAPWKTQKWVRRAVDTLYGPGPDGLCGDEDNGQMSAWYLFSTMGFYPVCPGDPSYIIGSPRFEEMSLQLPNGKTFTIKAKNNSNSNMYIQSATLNGKDFSTSWISHQDIANGGTIEFVMGPEPNKDWASDPADAPFSLSKN